MSCVAPVCVAAAATLREVPQVDGEWTWRRIAQVHTHTRAQESHYHSLLYKFCKPEGMLEFWPFSKLSQDQGLV